MNVARIKLEICLFIILKLVNKKYIGSFIDMLSKYRKLSTFRILVEACKCIFFLK